MRQGKTIQLIALILLAQQEAGAPAPAPRRRRKQDAAPAGAAPFGPVLLVCPTSVVGNWQHELARFSPALRILVHHGAGRTKEDLAGEAQRYDIVLTSYALLPRDEAGLAAVDWQAVVLDEAQNVK